MPRLFPKFQQIRQARQCTPILEELVRQEFRRAGTALDVDAETNAEEGFEFTAEFLRCLEAGRAVSRDEVESLERFFVQVRGFGLDHLNGHDAERPDVDFGAVFFLLDDFRRHPVRGSDHCGAFALGFGKFGAETEIGCGALVKQVSLLKRRRRG